MAVFIQFVSNRLIQLLAEFLGSVDCRTGVAAGRQRVYMKGFSQTRVCARIHPGFAGGSWAEGYFMCREANAAGVRPDSFK